MNNQYILMLFYDLPLQSEKDKVGYRKFRKLLLSKGFYLIQESVYCLQCKEKEKALNIIENLKVVKPSKGDIRALVITKLQFRKMHIIQGELSFNEMILKEENLLIEL